MGGHATRLSDHHKVSVHRKMYILKDLDEWCKVYLITEMYCICRCHMKDDLGARLVLIGHRSDTDSMVNLWFGDDGNDVI